VGPQASRFREERNYFVDVFRPLPYFAGLINRMILKAIAVSPFIRDAKKNHGAPERRMAQIWS
jgi:hypothetical protein